MQSLSRKVFDFLLFYWRSWEPVRFILFFWLMSSFLCRCWVLLEVIPWLLKWMSFLQVFLAGLRLVFFFPTGLASLGQESVDSFLDAPPPIITNIIPIVVTDPIVILWLISSFWWSMSDILSLFPSSPWSHGSNLSMIVARS